MSEEFIRMKVPPRAEVLYDFANEPTFPMCTLEFEEENTEKEDCVKIKVKSNLYNRIIKEYGSNKIILYCNLQKKAPVRFGAFSPDMQNSFSILKDLGLVSDEKDWVKNSQEFIEDFLEEE